MSEIYISVENEATAEIVEKKSRFIANIRHVESEAEAMQFVDKIRKEHYNARHNVYAYILAGGIKKYTDDGEPSKTAGLPILEMLEKQGITDVVCVVTRYFGGTLLGTGGLVRAYTEGAKIAVAAAGIKTMAESADVLVCCDYGLYGKIEHFINEHKILVVSSDFGADVSVTVRLRTEDVSAFEKDMVELTSAKAKTDVISRGWNEM